VLKDRRQVVEKIAANQRLRRQIVQQYGTFLRTLFGPGDWFVTLTFRDRHQDSQSEDHFKTKVLLKKSNSGRNSQRSIKCPPDPRIESWEPDSKNRRQPGPPVKDLAMREIEHWLLELGWEAAGRSRQEIFDRIADGLIGNERRSLARRISKKCLCCTLLNDPALFSVFYEIRKIATAAIGWVIAEEFGRAGGRWHVHLLVRGAQDLRRKKYWRRAFVRFGRNRIEPIHE
jgi:hypothetical protein